MTESAANGDVAANLHVVVVLVCAGSSAACMTNVHMADSWCPVTVQNPRQGLCCTSPCDACGIVPQQAHAAKLQACREVPIMVPGVIGVSSTGVNGNKAYYSNYATRFVTVRRSRDSFTASCTAQAT